jgi:PEP-CTERM motif
VKTLRLPATLAALILTASTACAAVMDFGNALGPSGGYTSQAYYQAMLGGQPMTAGQQVYADQEDQLRQLGFQSELGGDAALGQMFYRLAYGMAPPPSALDLVGGESGLGSSSTAPSGLGADSSGASDTGSSYGSDGGSVFTVTQALPPDLGGFSLAAVPEPSTWAMMLLGFGGLGYAGWRGSRKPALHAA